MTLLSFAAFAPVVYLGCAQNPLHTFLHNLQLVTDLLRTCHGETGVMDFGLYTANSPVAEQPRVTAN